MIVNPTPTTTQTTAPINGDLWDMYAPPIPVKPPAPKIIDVRPWFFFSFTNFYLIISPVKYRKQTKNKPVYMPISFLYLAFGRIIQ